MLRWVVSFGVFTFSMCFAEQAAYAGVGDGKKILFIRGGDRTGGFLEAGNDVQRTEHLADIDNTTTGGGNHGWGQLAAALRGEGFTVEQLKEGSESGSGQAAGIHLDFESVDLSDVDVLVFGSNNAIYDTAAVDAIDAWVRAGGRALFISDANFGGDWADASDSDQQFLDRFGLIMHQDRGTYAITRSNGEFLVPTHPIFTGIDEFHGEGVTPIRAAPTLPSDVTVTVLARAEGQTRLNEAPFGNNRQGPSRASTASDAALLVAEVGAGLVVGHYDRNTFFNQGGVGSDITRFDNQQYAINLFGFMANFEAANQPPEVEAGGDQSVTLTNGTVTVNLSATVSDDGLPADPGAVSTTWSVLTGPGGASFGDASASATAATFDRVGEYVLEVAASDGALRESDTLVVTVDGRESASTHSLPPDLPGGTYSTENAFPGLLFADPVALVTPPGESNRLFVVEQIGRIAVIPDLENPTKEIFLDIQSSVRANGNEEGLLGLAFHPNYHAAGQPGFGEFFVFYQITVNGQRHWRLSRFTASSGNANRADAGSEVPMITQRDQAGNHNGGDLHFGDDGYLYVSVGDEGGANDTYDNGQHIDKDYFAAILRLDVDSLPGNLSPNSHPAVHAGTYRIPADNPFVGATSFNGSAVNASNVRTEIWAIGMRNPWRMSFDRPTGRLFVADVGQGAREEINVLDAATFAGNGGVPNYGWSYREGFQAFTAGPGGATPPGGFSAIDPIHDYPRSLGRSVTGGLVYRGSNYPELSGDYLFADYVSGRIWAMHDPVGANQAVSQIASDNQIAGFGINPRNGDILLADDNSNRANDDVIKRLVRTEGGGAQPPAQLSGTGFFEELEDLIPAVGVVPYEVNVPFWSDHAEKTRWFAMPDDGSTMTWAENGAWAFPEGQVWVKHFELDLNRDSPGTNVRRVETRFLVKTADDVYGLTYRWNDAQTDADLVSADGLEEDFTILEGGQSRTQTWKYPSRADCRTCHNPTAGFALGFDTRQLNRDFARGAGAENQIAWLESVGYFSNDPPDPVTLGAHSRADDESTSLEIRARSYLAVNCVQCHQPGGPALGNWDARPWLTLEESGLVDGEVINNGGNPDFRLVAPGDPGNSMILQRLVAMETPNGFTPMPPVGSCEANAEAISLLTDWIVDELGTGLPAPQNVTASDGANAGGIEVAWDSVEGANEGHSVYRGTTSDFGNASLLADGIGGGLFTDSTATLGTTYYYWVTASRDGSESAPGGPDTGYLALAAPTNFAAADTETGVDLSWNAVAGADGYEVRRGSFDNPSLASPLATVGTPAYLDSAAQIGRDYYYFVRAKAEVQNGPWSSSVMIRRLFPAPENLTASTEHFDRVVLNWDTVPGATGHFVFRSETANREDAVFLTQVVESSYVDDEAAIGAIYHYWVSGFSGINGQGRESGPVAGQRKGGVRVPVGFPANTAAFPETVPLGSADPSLRGAFVGLLLDANVAGEVLGQVRVVVSGGKLAIVMERNGVRQIGRGISWEPDGSAVWEFIDRDEVNWRLDLMLGVSENGTRIEGELFREGALDAIFSAGTNPHHPRLRPFPESGAFTVLLGHRGGEDFSREPGGDSVATGFVNSAGRFRFVWRFADGSRGTCAGMVDADGLMPLLVFPYGKREGAGQVAGWLTFRETPGIGAFDGTLHWVRGAGGSSVPGGLYPDGFDFSAQAIGNRFERTRPGLPLIVGLNDTDQNAIWSLTNGALNPEPGNRWLTWDSADRVRDDGIPADGRTVVRVNRRNGLVTGFFEPAGGGPTNRRALNGVILQEQGKVSGWFPGDGESGLLAIEPNQLPLLQITDGDDSPVESGNTLDFGSIGIDGGFGERWLELENAGEGRLFLPEMPQLINGRPAFSLVSARAGMLEPGERARVRLRFDPESEGVASGVLRIASNDLAATPFLLNLTGSGIPGSASDVEGGSVASPVFANAGAHEPAPTQVPFDPELAPSRFGGLIQGHDGDFGWGRMLVRPNARAPSGGLFSGRLTLAGKTGIISGSVQADGGFVLLRKVGALFRELGELSLSMAEDAGGEPSLVGVLDSGNPERGIAFVLRLQVSPAAVLPAGVEAGPTAVALPMSEFLGAGYPAGDGIGSLQVRPRGNWRLRLRLADGQRRTLGGRVFTDGSLSFQTAWPLGTLLGRWQFGNIPGVGNLGGVASWHRRPHPRQKFWPEGFRIELPVVGNRHVPPATGDRALPGLTATAGNALAFGSEAAIGFPDDWEALIDWNERNRLSASAGALDDGERFFLSVNPRNGWMKGRLIQRPGGALRVVNFEGMILQTQEIVTGAWSDRDGNQGRFGVEPVVPAP